MANDFQSERCVEAQKYRIQLNAPGGIIHFLSPEVFRSSKPVRCSLRLLAAIALSATICFSGTGTTQADPLDDWQTNVTSLYNYNVPGIAYGNGKFVAVGGTFLDVSPDGTHWTQYISPPVLNYNGIIFGDGVFMTFGTPVTNSGPSCILQSSDGLHWTNEYETDTPIQIIGGAYGNNEFVFVGNGDLVGGDIIVGTLNPPQWYEFPLGYSVYPLSGITYGNGQFVATEDYDDILSSADGALWQYDYTANYMLGNIAYGNGMFVAACATNFNGSVYSNPGSYGIGFLVSSNLKSWQYVPLDLSPHWDLPPGNVAFGGGDFIGTDYNGSTYTSTDGFNWVDRVGAYGATVFAFGDGSFVAYDGADGGLIQSGVFAPLTNSPSALAIAAYPGVTVNGTAGATYQIQFSTSPNATWQALTNITLPYSPYLWIDTSSPMLGQRFYRSVQLQ